MRAISRRRRWGRRWTAGPTSAGWTFATGRRLNRLWRGDWTRPCKKGCDGVEPDNVTAYANDSGFAISEADQIAYNIWLAEAAHTRGLSIGLKNALDLVETLEPHFDWALNEECFQYDECEALRPFTQAGKAVFGVEYEGDPAEFCPVMNELDFDWLFKRLDLDAWRVACRESAILNLDQAFVRTGQFLCNLG